MARFFRLTQLKWLDGAMSGYGAEIAGGRWNPKGLAAVYLAESRALAALEVIVHAPNQVLRLEWRVIPVELPDECVAELETARIPDDWKSLPSSAGARRVGEGWLRSKSSLAIRVPSVIVPQESIIVLNPKHDDIIRMRVFAPEAFRFDPRFPGAVME